MSLGALISLLVLIVAVVALFVGKADLTLAFILIAALAVANLIGVAIDLLRR